MPRACPVVIHAGQLPRHRLSAYHPAMPRACPVVIHAGSYKASRPLKHADATGLPRGPSRWPLQISLTSVASRSMLSSRSFGIHMRIQAYSPNELNLAYCYRLYLRWRTHRNRTLSILAKLDTASLADAVSSLGVNVLESATNASEVMALVSLRPTESTAACASKLKGRVSKYISLRLGLTEPTKLLSRGYFGCTTGKSTRVDVERYLNNQAEHHGYAKRVIPPIHVATYPVSEEEETYVDAKHAATVLRFHIVLCTARRRGLFGRQESEALATEWRRRQQRLRIALTKVSFVPDHVHIALRAHPSVAPVQAVTELMNAAQEVYFERFATVLTKGHIDRLWQPSAYVGSYGDLASPQIQRYLQNWAAQESLQPA